MKPYRILLFDADDTLFDFQKAEEQALDKALQMHGFPHDEAIKQDYKKINSELWQAFEKGLIDKEAIKSQRFTRLFQQYQIAYDGTLFNEEYLRYLGEGSDLLPRIGTVDLFKHGSKTLLIHKAVVMKIGNECDIHLIEILRDLCGSDAFIIEVDALHTDINTI